MRLAIGLLLILGSSQAQAKATCMTSNTQMPEREAMVKSFMAKDFKAFEAQFNSLCDK